MYSFRNEAARKSALVILLAASVSLAQDKPRMSSSNDHSSHIMVTPSDLKWLDGPPSLPVGAKFVVLEGDPKSAGPLTMRLKLPDDYKVPAHWHPVIEHVTVLSGELYMGLGDKLDEGKSKALPVGSFAVMPANTNHFAWTDEETTIQLHAMGPWEITYVNPSDDPRKMMSEKK